MKAEIRPNKKAHLCQSCGKPIRIALKDRDDKEKRLCIMCMINTIIPPAISAGEK